MQGFQCHSRQEWVKKLVKIVNIRTVTLNIGTPAGKGMNLTETIIRRNFNIACSTETE